MAPGDNLSIVAVKFDVSVQANIDVNPSADPRRLAIGQTNESDASGSGILDPDTNRVHSKMETAE